MSTRREFVGGSFAAALTAKTAFGSGVAAKLPVAAIVTTYGPDTHADAIVTKILEGYAHDGGPGPGLKLTSLYVDQQHPKGMSRALAEKHGFQIAKSIDEALTVRGNRLAVSGVLIIAEHGLYPYDADTGQKQYPRRRLFDEVTATTPQVDCAGSLLARSWPSARRPTLHFSVAWSQDRCPARRAGFSLGRQVHRDSKQRATKRIASSLRPRRASGAGLQR
jgi:hypothetical protein